MTDEELFEKLKPYREVLSSLKRGVREFEQGRKEFHEGYGFGDPPSLSGYIQRVLREDADNARAYRAQRLS